MSTNKAPRNALERILRGVLVGANLGTILLLWMSVLSTYLPPDLFPRLSLAGLAFPVFLVANILFVFLWLIFRAFQIPAWFLPGNPTCPLSVPALH